jgi:hypothetical protein
MTPGIAHRDWLSAAPSQREMAGTADRIRRFVVERQHYSAVRALPVAELLQAAVPPRTAPASPEVRKITALKSATDDISIQVGQSARRLPVHQVGRLLLDRRARRAAGGLGRVRQRDGHSRQDAEQGKCQKHNQRRRDLAPVFRRLGGIDIFHTHFLLLRPRFPTSSPISIAIKEEELGQGIIEIHGTQRG